MTEKLDWFLRVFAFLTMVIMIVSSSIDVWATHLKKDMSVNETAVKFSFGIWKWEVGSEFVIVPGEANITTGKKDVHCKNGLLNGIDGMNVTTPDSCQQRCNFKKSASIIAPIFAGISFATMFLHGDTPSTGIHAATFGAMLVAFAFDLTLISLLAQEFDEKKKWTSADAAADVGICAYNYEGSTYKPAWGPSYGIAIAGTVLSGLFCIAASYHLRKIFVDE